MTKLASVLWSSLTMLLYIIKLRDLLSFDEQNIMTQGLLQLLEDLSLV